MWHFAEVKASSDIFGMSPCLLNLSIAQFFEGLVNFFLRLLLNSAVHTCSRSGFSGSSKVPDCMQLSAWSSHPSKIHLLPGS